MPFYTQVNRFIEAVTTLFPHVRSQTEIHPLFFLSRDCHLTIIINLTNQMQDHGQWGDNSNIENTGVVSLYMFNLIS